MTTQAPSSDPSPYSVSINASAARQCRDFTIIITHTASKERFMITFDSTHIGDLIMEGLAHALREGKFAVEPFPGHIIVKIAIPIIPSQVITYQLKCDSLRDIHRQIDVIGAAQPTNFAERILDIEHTFGVLSRSSYGFIKEIYRRRACENPAPCGSSPEDVLVPAIGPNGIWLARDSEMIRCSVPPCVPCVVGIVYLNGNFATFAEQLPMIICSRLIINIIAPAFVRGSALTFHPSVREIVLCSDYFAAASLPRGCGPVPVGARSSDDGAPRTTGVKYVPNARDQEEPLAPNLALINTICDEMVRSLRTVIIACDKPNPRVGANPLIVRRGAIHLANPLSFEPTWLAPQIALAEISMRGIEAPKNDCAAGSQTIDEPFTAADLLERSYNSHPVLFESD